MDLVIVHKNGWACTNQSEESYRMVRSKGSAIPNKKIPQIRATGVFNVVGSINKNDEAFVIIDKDGSIMGFNSKVLGTVNNTLTVDLSEKLDNRQVKSIIKKIKDHGSTR